MILALLATVSFQNIATLDRSVAAFIGHGVGEEGGARAPIDARLRLAACPTVSLSWRTPAQDAVVVTCAGPDANQSWRLFVPVRRVTPVAATTTTIATRAAALQFAPVRAAPVIKRGDPVVIEAGQDGFSITREGIAQADAAPGASFAVRVDGKPLPVQAVALADGRATLPGWGN